MAKWKKNASLREVIQMGNKKSHPKREAFKEFMAENWRAIALSTVTSLVINLALML